MCRSWLNSLTHPSQQVALHWAKGCDQVTRSIVSPSSLRAYAHSACCRSGGASRWRGQVETRFDNMSASEGVVDSLIDRSRRVVHSGRRRRRR